MQWTSNGQSCCKNEKKTQIVKKSICKLVDFEFWDILYIPSKCYVNSRLTCQISSLSSNMQGHNELLKSFPGFQCFLEIQFSYANFGRIRWKWYCRLQCTCKTQWRKKIRKKSKNVKKDICKLENFESWDFFHIFIH